MHCSAISSVRAQGRWRAGKEGGDFIDRPQMPLGIGKAMLCQAIDGRAQARRGQHLVQRLPAGRVVMHVARGDKRQACMLREGASSSRRPASSGP